ncbi:MAG: hypothetical protein R6V62_05800 [Candidatus Fermentibacteraceae bacterium]
MTHLLVMVLLAASPSELEASGLLPEAGIAWEERGNVPGQLRIMTTMLEDALYSADVRRAWLLAGELSQLGAEDALLDFWLARIAWGSGLRTEASDALARLETPDPWLHHRARGLSLLYGGNPREAVTQLALSVSAAGTARRGFYASLDLSCALIASGETTKALEVSELLCAMFPNDALARVMKGLCLQLSGQSAAAARELSSLSPGHPPGARNMAARLMREFTE